MRGGLNACAASLSSEPRSWDRIKQYSALLNELYRPARCDDPHQTSLPFVVRRVERMKPLRTRGDKRTVSLDIDSAALEQAIVRTYPEDDISPDEFLLPLGAFSKEILLDFDAHDSKGGLNLATRGTAPIVFTSATLLVGGCCG